MKLTAEQVRDAIYNGSVYANYDGVQYYASGIDMHAVADELSAKLDVEECEPEVDTDYIESKVDVFSCSNCGWDGIVDNGAVKTTIPNYCPNCGARVRKAVRR